jgi:hypothetical protein
MNSVMFAEKRTLTAPLIALPCPSPGHPPRRSSFRANRSMEVAKLATLKERRETDRLRQQRWRDKQRKQGKKQISAMISLKAQIILNREKRRTRSTTSDVIEQAILLLNERSKK